MLSLIQLSLCATCNSTARVLLLIVLACIENEGVWKPDESERVNWVKSSLTSKKVVSPGFWVRYAFDRSLRTHLQNKVLIFYSRFRWLIRKQLCWPFAFEGLWRVNRSYLSKLRCSSSNIITMLRCVKDRNSKLRRFTSVNYCLFVSLKNRGKMAKRSNQVIIIVLNFVRIYECYSLHSVAFFHGSAHNAYRNAFPAALTYKKVHRSRFFQTIK